MKRTHALILALLGLLSLTAIRPLQAQVIAAPSLMNFQGRLAKPDGTPVPNGNYSIRFSLWTAVSGGTEKWNQTINPVTVRNGTFAVLLNTSTGAADKFNADLWLEIKIGTAAPLTPRQQLVSVPYAMKANSVPDDSIGAAQLATDFASLAKVSGDVLASDGTYATLNDKVLRLRSLTDPFHGLGYFGTYDGVDLDGPALFGFAGGALGVGNRRILTWTGEGRVGIGTATPATTLEVNGTTRMTGFELPTGAGAGKVLTADASGVGTWQDAAGAGWNLTGNAGINPASNFLGTTDLQPLVFRTNNTEKMRILDNGNVGIGTTTPAARLHVSGGNIRLDEHQELFIVGNGQIRSADDNHRIRFRYSENKMEFREYGDIIFSPGSANADAAKTVMLGNGNVGIGILAPAAKLHVLANMGSGAANDGGIVFQHTNQTQGIGFGYNTIYATGPVSNQHLILLSRGTGSLLLNPTLGNVGIGTSTPGVKLDVAGEIRGTVVTITGGSDVAEPYEIASAGDVKPIPGFVVAIDPNHVGQMRVASSAYDTTVAGIVSGANGINPGITLRQKGTVADGALPVASIGRVWCWCDADASGPIVAGDMLTTSDTPGHAMKAVDKERRDGAVIGKAMSSLKSGKGLVLVLVSLK